MKHYFFLDLGDFLIHFLDAADNILDEETKKVSIERLESLLELAIRTSSANLDPFKDDLVCELNTYSLSEQLFALKNIRGALSDASGANRFSR